MDANLNNYQERRDKVCSLLGKSSGIFMEYDKPTAELLDQLKESTAKGKFSIIIAGQFDSGKSTFLNALMGKKYLPSFTKETTATINELKSVEESPTGKEALRINYKDGRVVVLDDVSLETISKYVCTDGDDVVNTIDSVELFLDSPFLNNGVRLIDTPGLNGIAEGHADVTKKEFGQAHAGIFMFNSSAPGTQSDYSILKEMKSYGSSLICVLNQIDLIKESEHETPESVIDNLRSGFRKQFPGETLPEIWPLSAYQALVGRNPLPMTHNDVEYNTPELRERILIKSRIESFEERLMRYLTMGERARFELLSPVRQLEGAIARYCEEHIEKPLSVLNSNLEAGELTSRKEALEAEIARIREENRKNTDTLRMEINILINNAEDAIKSSSRDIKKRYGEKLEKSEGDLDEFESDSRSMLRRMEGEYRAQIEEALDDLDRGVMNIISERCRDYSSIISRHSYRKSSGVNIESDKIDDSIFEVDLEINGSDDLERLYSRHDSLTMSAAEEKYLADVAERNRQDQKELESQMMDTSRFYRELENNLGERPAEEIRYKNVRKKTGGIVGFYKLLFTGDRSYNAREEYLDTTRRDNYDRRMQDLRTQRDDEMAEYYVKKAELRNLDADDARHKAKARQIEEEKAALERQISQLKEKRETELNRELRKRLRIARDYVDGCMDALSKSVKSSTIASLNERREVIVGYVNEIIDDILAMAASDKTSELNTLISKIENGEEEIAREKKKLEERREILKALLGEAVDLRREIEDVPVDTIEQE